MDCKLVTDLIDKDDNEQETSDRMFLLLRAGQWPKQNHEEVLLPDHLQELYLSVKYLGLILSQKLIRLSLTQCQNN